MRSGEVKRCRFGRRNAGDEPATGAGAATVRKRERAFATTAGDVADDAPLAGDWSTTPFIIRSNETDGPRRRG
ncbi:hypothetical protein BRC90_02510 [Halobacteriales archaeon QS_4_69_34]|nr:MAG: hypothetical protein BRC90_02510 [Halobacteriales archaeon QS_4_69_34]